MNSTNEFDECMSCICFGVRRAARAITQHYDRVMRPLGLRATQFNMLVALAHAGALGMSDLARVLGLDRTSLTRNLKPVERKGWVRVEQGEDRRRRTVAITPAGIAALRQAVPAWRKAQASAAPRLGAFGLAPAIPTEQ
jgi:DNA-binding MarR family transcriptional regulator